MQLGLAASQAETKDIFSAPMTGEGGEATGLPLKSVLTSCVGVRKGQDRSFCGVVGRAQNLSPQTLFHLHLPIIPK